MKTYLALALVVLLLSAPSSCVADVFGGKEGFKIRLKPSSVAKAIVSSADFEAIVLTPTTTTAPEILVDPSKVSTCKPMLLQAREKVVMGLALSYKWEKFEHFVLTLRASGYTGSIVLGIGKDASEEVKAKLLENCVTGLIVDDSVSTITSKGETMPFAAGRFLLFDSWLQQLELKESAWVLVSRFGTKETNH
jgi:hypothetical protein